MSVCMGDCMGECESWDSRVRDERERVLVQRAVLISNAGSINSSSNRPVGALTRFRGQDAGSWRERSLLRFLGTMIHTHYRWCRGQPKARCRGPAVREWRIITHRRKRDCHRNTCRHNVGREAKYIGRGYLSWRQGTDARVNLKAYMLHLALHYTSPSYFRQGGSRQRAWWWWLGKTSRRKKGQKKKTYFLCK